MCLRGCMHATMHRTSKHTLVNRKTARTKDRKFLNSPAARKAEEKSAPCRVSRTHCNLESHHAAKTLPSAAAAASRARNNAIPDARHYCGKRVRPATTCMNAQRPPGSPRSPRGVAKVKHATDICQVERVAQKWRLPERATREACPRVETTLLSSFLGCTRAL